MKLEELLAAIQQLQMIVIEQQKVVSGDAPHVLKQLEGLIQAQLADQTGQIEQKVTISIKESQGMIIGFGRELERVRDDLVRKVDLAVAETAQNTEFKTTQHANRIIEALQVMKDVIINSVGGKITPIDLSNVELTPATIKRVENELTAIFDHMIQERFSPLLLKEGFERLRIVDSVRQMFEVVFVQLFDGPDSVVSKVMLKHVTSSPDFGPSMEVLFGPHGKLAAAASAAVTGTDLVAASEGLEKKLETSVKKALDEAGDKAAAHAGKALASKIGEGATALGNIYTAVPQLYSSVQELGEAWDKPLQSTEDYMNLFSKLGGALSQGVQTVQALAGVTKIAAAAQAVFNAVMAMNPIVLIVIAVIALIALIAALIVYWDQVKAAVRDNPWVAAIGVIFGPLGMLISLIVLVISYWDELKLAVLRGANFISIKVQQVGAVFVGLKNLIGMVWEWIMGSVYNLGVGILNTFIVFGANFVNLFIEILNDLIGMANRVIKYIPGVSYIKEVEKINVEASKIAEKKLPAIDAGAAFAGVGQVTGGLEGQIAKQEEVVRKGKEADDERRRKAREEGAAPVAPPGVPGLPAGLPAAGLAAPVVPLAGAGAVAAADHSVHVEGGIHITITAERLEADSAKLLTDEMVRRLQERLDALRTERERRLGTRAAAPA